MVPAVTFSVYAIRAYLQGTESLNTVQAFTSLALIHLLTTPAGSLLAAIPAAASSVGCFDRIQDYLLSESRLDGRVISPKFMISEGVSNYHDEDILQDILEPPLEIMMVEIENASFRPAIDAEILLPAVNLQIRPGTIVMITGPVGAGKTTLLKAIIGDILPDSGAVFVKTRRMGKVSFPHVLSGSCYITSNHQHSSNYPLFQNISSNQMINVLPCYCPIGC